MATSPLISSASTTPSLESPRGVKRKRDDKAVFNSVVDGMRQKINNFKEQLQNPLNEHRISVLPWGSGTYIGPLAKGRPYTTKDKPYGKMHFDTGDIYIGSWRNGRFNGVGELSSQEGMKFLSMWQCGAPLKFCEWQFTDGSVFKGNFAHSRPVNECVYIKNQEVITGSTLEGKWEYCCSFSGRGKIERENFRYEGEIINNQPHGYGRSHETLENGKTFSYFGDFVEGKKQGDGKSTTVYSEYLTKECCGIWDKDAFSSGTITIYNQDETYRCEWSQTDNEVIEVYVSGNESSLSVEFVQELLYEI